MAKAFQLIEKWEDEHGSKSSKGKAGDDEEVGVGFVQQVLPRSAKADVDCYPPRKRKRPSTAKRQRGNKPSRPERSG